MNQKKNRWKWTALILMIVMIGGLFSAGAYADAGTPGDVEQVAAVILHTNDAHVAFEDNIGYDGLALYKKELEAVYDHVLLIDAGDAIQGAPIGSVSKGTEIIRMMNRLGYDLAVPGNHEFDYGLEALDDCAEALDCGYTCANFCVTGGEPVFQPWRILEAGDLKIGFVGAVTPDAYTKSTIKDILNEAGEPMYDFLADETGQRLCVGLQKAIDETRQAGADYVILVSHLGNNDSITEQFRTDAVVGKLRGLDLIIDGHSHETYNRTVTDGENRQVPIAQTGSNMKAIGQIKIYKDGRLEETLIDTVPEPANMPFEKVVRRNVERCVDPEMKAFLDEIVASYAPVMNRKVGEVSYDMIVRDADGFDVSRVEENGLCDFVADAYRTVGGTRAALVNAGAVRNNLKAGTVTYNDILNILPYSNDVVTASVTGQMLLDALEFGVSKLPAVSGGFLQVSGITFRVNPELESSVVVDDKNQFVSVAGEYRVSDVMVGQEPLDQKAEYTLTGTSFLLNGGDGYAMFKEADILSMTMLPDNEVVIKYLEEYLDGVIPEDYREAQGRILMTPSGKTTEIALDPIAAEDVYETADSVVMSMDILRVTEEVTPEDIAHTMTYIEKTKKGEMKKREPFSVVERGDGTYSILDGNKSFSALKELGAKSVPVIVADRPYHKDVESFEELVALYSEAEAEFHQVAASLGEKLKAEVSAHSDLTDADAIHRRAKEKYDGDYGKVVDVLSAGIRVPAVELQETARKLLENDKVLCVYKHEKDNAYTTYIRLSNGAIAELRLKEVE